MGWDRGQREATMRHVDGSGRPRCQEWVTRYQGLADYSGQCEKPAKGDTGFCAIHSKEAKARRAAKSREAYEEKRIKWRDEWFGRKFRLVLEQIEAGHNDPRAAAKDILDEWRK